MMKNTEYTRGSATTAVIALIILIIFLGIGGFAYYHYGEKYEEENTAENTAISGSSIASSTTVASAVVGAGSVTRTTTELETVYKPAHTEVVSRPGSPFPGGSVYHNSAYGLSVPVPANWAGYSVYQNREFFGGFPSLASIHFNVAGTNPLTVNVFTKEQWNDIRNQENANHLNVNSLGEGIYLGENFTYIFSTQTLTPESQSILPYILFY
jgi:hypothetical protein